MSSSKFLLLPKPCWELFWASWRHATTRIALRFDLKR